MDAGDGFAAGVDAGIARFYVFVFMLVDGTKQLPYTDGATDGATAAKLTRAGFLLESHSR